MAFSRVLNSCPTNVEYFRSHKVEDLQHYQMKLFHGHFSYLFVFFLKPPEKHIFLRHWKTLS